MSGMNITSDHGIHEKSAIRTMYKSRRMDDRVNLHVAKSYIQYRIFVLQSAQ